MSDLLAPFDRFDRPLPAGLPFVEPGPPGWDVLHEPVDPQDPCWSDCSVDLSAPPEVDGEPVRLDALDWAIGVLGRRLRADVARSWEPVAILAFALDHLAQMQTDRAGAPDLSAPMYWYDHWRQFGAADFLAGLDLTGPGAPRVFVAAALRARVGLGEATP